MYSLARSTEIRLKPGHIYTHYNFHFVFTKAASHMILASYIKALCSFIYNMENIFFITCLQIILYRYNKETAGAEPALGHSIYNTGVAGYCYEFKITFILSLTYKFIRKAYNKNNTSCFEGNTLIAGPSGYMKYYYNTRISNKKSEKG